MDANIPLKLRHKYGLVHVPSRSRVDRWYTTARTFIESGLPPEAAGRQAAREVFPYEAREIYVPDAESVEFLLSRGEADHPL